MRRTLILLAVAMMTASSVGCGCCRPLRDWFYRGGLCGPGVTPAATYASVPAPMPVYSDAGCGTPYVTEMGCGVPYASDPACGYIDGGYGVSSGQMMYDPAPGP